RMDHIERAFRKAEIPLLVDDYTRQQAEDKAAFEATSRATIDAARQAHQEKLETKHRLSRIMPDYQVYLGGLNQNRRQDHHRRTLEANNKILEEKAKQRDAVLKQREREAHAREEQERAQKEKEEEAARLEQEEQRKREEDENAKAAEEEKRKKRDQERAADLERIRKQQEREEEAERRRQARSSTNLLHLQAAQLPPALNTMKRIEADLRLQANSLQHFLMKMDSRLSTGLVHPQGHIVLQVPQQSRSEQWFDQQQMSPIKAG
ncbi:6673_t:CDS:2, partial [Acaulospora colombiana]